MAKDIKAFRGIYMRNSLPRHAAANETAIINLGDKDGPGTHWVAYEKYGNLVILTVLAMQTPQKNWLIILVTAPSSTSEIRFKNLAKRIMVCCVFSF